MKRQRRATQPGFTYLADFFFKLKPPSRVKISAQAWQQKKKHCHHPTPRTALSIAELQKNSGQMTSYYKGTRTSQKKRPRVIARKQKYKYNSPTSVEGCISFLILLTLEQLGHSTV
jgi:hypothetical protein